MRNGEETFFNEVFPFETGCSSNPQDHVDFSVRSFAIVSPNRGISSLRFILSLAVPAPLAVDPCHAILIAQKARARLCQLRAIDRKEISMSRSRHLRVQCRIAKPPLRLVPSFSSKCGSRLPNYPPQRQVLQTAIFAWEKGDTFLHFPRDARC